MVNSVLIPFLFISRLILSESFGVLLDINGCQNGCKNNRECPSNSACVSVSQSDNCGVCVCLAKFHAVDEKCVNNSESTSPSTVLETTTFLQPKSQIENGAVGDALTPRIDCKNFDFVCNESNCTGTLHESKHCRNSNSDNRCDSGTCFKVNENRSYCICPANVYGLSCSEEKSLTCKQSDNVIDGADVQFDKRWRSVGNPDFGSVTGRYFAADLTDCVKLCKWATPSVCRSINYGPIKGRMICEMLNVWATPNTFQLTSNFLHSAFGWLHMCCFK